MLLNLAHLPFHSANSNVTEEAKLCLARLVFHKQSAMKEIVEQVPTPRGSMRLAFQKRSALKGIVELIPTLRGSVSPAFQKRSACPVDSLLINWGLPRRRLWGIERYSRINPDSSGLSESCFSETKCLPR